MSLQHHILLFGATGATGKHALTAAIASGAKVTAFVRRPEAIPSDQRDKVTVVKGDYTDLDAVRSAVRDSHPTAIIIATALARYSNIHDFNAAAVPAILDFLRADNRIATTRIVYLGGEFTPPKGESISLPFTLLGYIFLPLFGITAQITDNNRSAAILQDLPDAESNFVFVRMGYVVEAPSKGRSIVGGNVSGGFSPVTFADVGRFLVRLAMDLGEHRGKTILMCYES